MSLAGSAIRLGAVCVIAAGSLAFVYKGTEARIAANKEAEKLRRLRWVMPGCPEVGPRQAPDGSDFYAGTKDGKPCGFALETKARGYGGDLVMLVGADAAGRVTGFSILSHKETPGLGDKAAGEAFRRQFIGLPAGKLRLRKDSPEGAIDALTAATITSRAAAAGVREGVETLARLRREGGAR
jgi:electron transport complex protein RnfG